MWSNEMELIRYGLKLKRTGELLGFYPEANPEDGECISVMFHLESRSDCKRIWLVDTPEKAEYVRTHSTDWHNADWKTPSHSFSEYDLEVVPVVMVYR